MYKDLDKTLRNQAAIKAKENEEFFKINPPLRELQDCDALIGFWLFDDGNTLGYCIKDFNGYKLEKMQYMRRPFIEEAINVFGYTKHLSSSKED